MNTSYEQIIETVNITTSFINDLRTKLKEYDDELQILISNILQSVSELQINDTDNKINNDIDRLDAIEQDIANLKETVQKIRLGQLPKVIVPKLDVRPVDSV
jgi:chromosome segregation ATPase